MVKWYICWFYSLVLLLSIAWSGKVSGVQGNHCKYTGVGPIDINNSIWVKIHGKWHVWNHVACLFVCIRRCFSKGWIRFKLWRIKKWLLVKPLRTWMIKYSILIHMITWECCCHIISGCILVLACSLSAASANHL